MAFLHPDLWLPDIHAITEEHLHALGVRGLMVDLDDTLVGSDDDSVPEDALAWTTSWAARGFRVVILSNGRPERVARFAEAARLPSFALAGKPLKKAFRNGLAALELRAEESVMIGDQIFTDVLGAKLAGTKSILVNPVTQAGLLHTRLLRRVEHHVLKGFQGGVQI